MLKYGHFTGEHAPEPPLALQATTNPPMNYGACNCSMVTVFFSPKTFFLITSLNNVDQYAQLAVACVVFYTANCRELKFKALWMYLWFGWNRNFRW